MSGSASASTTLPSSLHAETRGDIAILRLNRAEKRNALNDETVLGIETFFNHLPEGVKAVVLHGDGDHFSAGLDLSNLRSHDIEELRSGTPACGIASSTRSSSGRFPSSR